MTLVAAVSPPLPPIPPPLVRQINAFVPVLACRDRSLRVMKYSGVRYQVEVAGPPSTLHLFYGDGGSTAEYLLYGTTDATVGCVGLGR